MNTPQKSDDVCVVCCRNSSIYAVGACDHRVCFICSSRMRVLCLKNECPICRQDMPKVIFTKTGHPYSMLSKLNYRMDNKFKICFADDEIAEEYYCLLEESCPICPNLPKFQSFGHLKDHLRKQHEMFFCDLCVENLQLFTYERRCYNRKDLGRHKRTGDPEDTSHKGHPLCKYCDQRYVDIDDLYRHLRKDHYYCHFCDADGINTSFYADYNLLYNHFHEDHFVCEEGGCREDRYTGVFRSDIDLIAHKAAQHSKNLTKQQAKQARTLELNFSITPRSSQQNGNMMIGESERDGGYNRRGGRWGGHKGSRREPQNEKNFRTEMAITIPERLSPEPEAVVLNTQSEEDFPHLSTSGVAPENRNLGKSHRNAKPTKWNGGMTMIEEHFPLLSTSVTPSATGNTFMVQLNNKDQGTSHQQGQNSSIQLSSKLKTPTHASNFVGQAPVRRPQTTFTIVQTSHQGPTSNNGHVKGSFEQNFPRLGGEERMRTTVTVPIWKKADEPKPVVEQWEENRPKSKNKKKMEKSVPVEVQAKQKTSNDNGNKKKKKEPLEDNSITYSNDNDLKISTENPETTSKSLPKKTNDCVDGTKELQQKTHKLQLDDFPTLESVHPGKAVAPPGFQPAKQSKKPQPPPGFFAAQPNIGISLSSVAQELTSPSINNNADSSSFTNGASYTMNATYLEPQDFQLRNQNLIQEIRQVLQDDTQVFEQFKILSGQFRQSTISPKEYFAKCIELFGRENFNKVLPELLVLLPDITKQQELLLIYNKCKKIDAEGGGAVPKNGTWNVANMQFMVCASCQQVLCNKDFRNHMASHSDDFPSLVQPNRTTTQISWLKK